MNVAQAGRGRLTLVLPGYVPGATAGHDLDLSPALRALLARAAWTPDSNSAHDALLAAFGLSPEVSLAALLARAELGLTDPGWLRADPVHYRADAKLVMLMAPGPDEIAAADADALLDELRARLPEFDWRRGAEPRRWYARMPDLASTPVLGPAWLHGRSLTPFFPQGAAHRRWRQCMTETQMVMHDAAPNAGRATPLNALWIWGAGAAPRAQGTALRLCIGRDLMLAGAAQWSDVSRQASMDAASLRAALAEGHVLALAGTPHGTLEGPSRNALEEANALAAVAWPLLCAGGIEELELVGEGLRGRITRGARWRPWQRAVRGRFDDFHAVPRQ